MSAPRPAICRACRKLIGLEATCPWCGADAAVGPRAIGGPTGTRSARRRPRRVVAREPLEGGSIVTPVLLVVMVALYAGALLAGGAGTDGGVLDALAPDSGLALRLGLVRTALVLHGEWWRLIAAIFLHLSLLHLLFNAMALWNLGRYAEADMGRSAFWFVFMATGVAGFALAIPLEGTALAVPATAGASGSICGLIGAILARRRVLDGDFSAPVTRMAGQFALYTLIFGLIVPGINNVAHGGGFLAGLLLGALHATVEEHPAARGGWLAAGLVALGLTAGAAHGLLGSAERATGEEVLTMDRCVSDVVENWQAIGPGDQGLRPDFACLTATEPFREEVEALDALRGLRIACDRLEEARLAGDSRSWERALEALVRDAKTWRGWVASNLDRFGLRFQ